MISHSTNLEPVFGPPNWIEGSYNRFCVQCSLCQKFRCNGDVLRTLVLLKLDLSPFPIIQRKVPPFHYQILHNALPRLCIPLLTQYFPRPRRKPTHKTFKQQCCWRYTLPYTKGTAILQYQGMACKTLPMIQRNYTLT